MRRTFCMWQTSFTMTAAIRHQFHSCTALCVASWFDIVSETIKVETKCNCKWYNWNPSFSSGKWFFFRKLRKPPRNGIVCVFRQDVNHYLKRFRNHWAPPFEIHIVDLILGSGTASSLWMNFPRSSAQKATQIKLKRSYSKRIEENRIFVSCNTIKLKHQHRCSI